MKRTYSSNDEALNVAKEAMWLAYQASSPAGLGLLHERGGESRGTVISETFNEAGMGSADYCHGRMMKTHFRIKEGVLSCNDTPRYDYQSWAYKYPTYAALIDAAEQLVLPQSQSSAA